MSTTPPPLPFEPYNPAAEPRPSFYHKAANFAVIALCSAFIINLTAQLTIGKDPGQAQVRNFISIIGGVLFLSAIPAGIVALCGIRRHGSRGLLVKGIAGIVVPLVLTVVAFGAFQQVRKAANLIAVRAAAAEINKIAPKMLDNATRLEGATVGPEKKLTIRYTLINLKASEVDRDNWNQKAIPALKAASLSSGADLLRKGATVVYHYEGNDGQPIDDIVLTAADLPKK